MERAAIADVDASDIGADSSTRRLTDALGAGYVAVNHYCLAPGDGLPGGLHAHADQEEVFVVLGGEATFDICASPIANDAEENENREVTVAASEVVRFAPGDFQSGRNASDDELVALALGAPREGEAVRVPFACPECGDSTLALDFAGEFSFACPDCGTERVPVDCPECGYDNLRATLNDERSVVAACADCGVEYDQPAVRGNW